MKHRSAGGLPMLNKYYHVDTPDALTQLARDIRPIVRGRKDLIFACIGTDRSAGDCFGPYIGQLLTSYGLGDMVIGTLEAPLTAVNLEERLIVTKGRFVVAIDSSLSCSENIGRIYLKSGPFMPGSGLNKALPPVGDYNISGVINVGGFMTYLVLQNTRFYLIYRMAHIVAGAIAEAMEVASLREAAAAKAM